ncbi:MAG: hypothetical protein WAL56_21000 [Candidatus Sulfotelmatobacter sp.]
MAASLGAADTGVVSLKLTALNPVAKSGSGVGGQITVTNQSNRTITYHNTSRYCDYSVTVLANNGALAPETSFKKRMDKVIDCSGSGLRITGRNILVTLKPGESDSEQIPITELYDMSTPGEYTVQIERTFPEMGHFRSNAVSVKVAP